MTISREGQPVPDFDRCRVIEQLASGAVTDLYRAEQRSLSRRVLIKALKPNILPSSPFAVALEREARLLSELEHDNILRLYDFVRRDDTMWLVLEDVEGPTLAELLTAHGPLPPLAAAAVALQLGRALGHAHSHGIIHRDVQPRNIFVSRDGRLKLAHFAVATDHRLPTAPELLEGDSGFGIPAYMSPEQVLGEAPDPRSDLFSLGVVLYEMLTSVRPFDAPDNRAATQRIRHDPPAPLNRSGREVPPALERIVHRCLQKLPSDRFHSADELNQALHDLLGDAASAIETTTREQLAAAGVPMNVRGKGARKDWRPQEETRPPTLRSTVLFHAACLVALIGGLGAIEYASAKGRDQVGRRSSTRLELAPERAGYLKVVADPWAEVIVDGQSLRTTPFAEPIPLPAGVHYVRLEHPNASPERRTIRLSSGETILLDVKMDIRRPRPQTKAKSPPVPSTATDESTP